jgi:hypothetical protein
MSLFNLNIYLMINQNISNKDYIMILDEKSISFKAKFKEFYD